MLPGEAEVISELVSLFDARRIVRPGDPVCHLCQRPRDDLVEGKDGLLWCPQAQWPHCDRIARARLNGWTGYR